MLREELFGCFKYIGIPYGDLLNMPIQDRRYYIRRYNMDAEKQSKTYSSPNSSTIEGEGINNFSKNEQNFKKAVGK